MNVTSDGYLLDVWRFNRKGERVYPYLKGRRGQLEKGFDVTTTASRSDYRLMKGDELLDFLATGSFIEAGRIRMRSESGGQDGGYSLKNAEMSATFVAELLSRRDQLIRS
jgi:hypothetical protein